MMRWCILLLFLISSNISYGDEIKYDETKPLILTPYIKSNQTSEARDLSKVVFDGFDYIKSYSGYFTVNEEYNSNSFFWFFKSEDNYLKDPVILWLHGGPGLPSECGLFGESGPLSVKNGTLLSRDHSWTKNHSILYIDNPVGTGFSFTDDEGYATDQVQVGEELYKALVQFFTLFPELKENDFFLAGGSYAGKYIPAVGHFIHKNNPTSNVFINLKGLLIYSGLVDPVNQVVYGDFLYEGGLISNHEKNKLNVLRDLIVKYIKKSYFEVSTLLYNILMNEIKDNQKIANIYNYLHNDEYYTSIPDWIPYIMKTKTRRKLHVADTEFNYDVTNPDYKARLYLGIDWTRSVAPWFEELVDNYRCLLFNGELDVMIPYTSVSNYLTKLNFNASEEFKNADKHLWKVDDEIAGDCKTAGYLTECMVKNAGHSVPYEKPKYIFDLVYKFVRNISLYDKDIDIDFISDNNI